MTRIPEGDPSDPDASAVVEWMQDRGVEPIALRRVLLHAPPIAMAWLHMSQALRGDVRIGGRLRELVICRVALLLGSAYEWNEHARCALDEGVTADELAGLSDWPMLGSLSPRERVAMEVVDALRDGATIDDDLFARVRAAFDDTQIVELTTLIGFYHLVARFLGVLDIDLEPGERHHLPVR